MALLHSIFSHNYIIKIVFSSQNTNERYGIPRLPVRRHHASSTRQGAVNTYTVSLTLLKNPIMVLAKQELNIARF